MIEAVCAFLFGLLIGSFLNVCIWRWPRDLSVVWPGSRCVACGHPIDWFDNVPLLSYAWLGGRCRHCRSGIYWRYPVVELVTGLLFAVGAWKWGMSPAAAKFMLFAAMQVGMIFSDLETRLLPDEFTKGGLVIGLAAAWVAPLEDGIAGALATLYTGQGPSPRMLSLFEAGLAAAVASGSMWGVAWLYGKVRHREGLGFGDVKMVAMMGAFLGMRVLLAIFAGCILGTVLGAGYAAWKKKDLASYELPFGTFLGIAAIGVALLG